MEEHTCETRPSHINENVVRKMEISVGECAVPVDVGWVDESTCESAMSLLESVTRFTNLADEPPPPVVDPCTLHFSSPADNIHLRDAPSQ